MPQDVDDKVNRKKFMELRRREDHLQQKIDELDKEADPKIRTMLKDNLKKIKMELRRLNVSAFRGLRKMGIGSGEYYDEQRGDRKERRKRGIKRGT